MPLGFERLNERVSRPNALINFIKPLPGSTAATAEDFLSRIAAQCYPVMKANHIAVMALEEFPWNREFIGRNFNAGEVIQLVLRSRSGAWLPFQYVQMTMMHELAHCKQMNHSKAFWAVRNGYADHMRGLWGKGYKGEGLWGRGRGLENGGFMNADMPVQGEMPEQLCGGTYRRRGRKRKRGGPASGKEELSYAEKKQRRILKKFGVGGVALGDDETTRVKLEDGKKPKGKPRVAGSNRGRELRAAAALARFENIKQEVIKKEEATESDTEDEYDWPPTDDDMISVQRDGKAFVRVCEAEDEADEDVKREMDEMRDLEAIPKAPATSKRSKVTASMKLKPELESQVPLYRVQLAPNEPVDGSDMVSESDVGKDSSAITVEKALKETSFQLTGIVPRAKELDSTIISANSCGACSMGNDAAALICTTCSNVLHPSRTPNHWRCKSEACQGGVYINMGDYGRCQVCGAAKPP